MAIPLLPLGPALAARAAASATLLAALGVGASAQTAVTTQRYDNARTGQALGETVLTTSNVNSATFGRLFSRAVDDEVYAQPLYVPDVPVPGGPRNILFVATVNNTLYAFDAEDPGSALPLWSAHLNGGGRPVANTDVGQACGTYRDFSGRIGIVGTPVIDTGRGTIYLVSRTVEEGAFVQRLHAMDLATGAERPGSPRVVEASVAGAGDGSTGGRVAFDPRTQNQRGALALANDTVYVTWASYCDTPPYHGWIMGFDPSTLALRFATAVTPDGGEGGIWQSGTGPSLDDAGALYVTVGNGTVTAPSGGRDFGNAFLKVSANGVVADWFIPFNYQDLNIGDVDLGSAGVLLIPGTNLLASGGKEGKLYVLDRDDLGGFRAGADTQIVQSFPVAPPGRHFHGCPTYWNGPGGPWVYTWCEADRGKAFRLEDGRLTTTPVAQTAMTANDGMPGGMLAVSANGTTPGTGILWAALAFNGDANHDVRPGVLRAFDAADLSRELWNSRQNAARDDFGAFAKFNTPLVANGRVYLPTFSKQVVVYGLLPAGDAAPTVAAGPDRTISLPNAASLAGTVTDDGVPGALATTWIAVSGPGPVAFADRTSPTTTASFSVPGVYTLRLTASDGLLASDAEATVTVLPEGAVVGTGTGVTGEYYDDVDFAGAPLVRTDSTIDFDWGAGSPDPSIGADTFSVRWTGQVQASFSETYTFTTLSDDGVRLWVAGRLLVDNWTDHGATEDSGSIALVKGQRYDLRMELYEDGGDALARLSWSSPSTSKSVVPTLQLYASGPVVDSCTPATAARGTRVAVIVRGSSFTRGSRVSFGDRIEVVSKKVISPTEIDVVIKIRRRAAAGPRDVVVTDADGRRGAGRSVFAVT